MGGLPEQPWILVVEDERELADLLVRKLSNEGFRVLWCGKVSEANHKLANQKFSCILLDMRLEQGTGEQVLSRMRGDAKNPNFATPVLVTSAYLSTELVKRIAKDIQGVLVKPFEPNALVEKVKQMSLQKK